MRSPLSYWVIFCAVILRMQQEKSDKYSSVFAATSMGTYSNALRIIEHINQFYPGNSPRWRISKNFIWFYSNWFLFSIFQLQNKADFRFQFSPRIIHYKYKNRIGRNPYAFMAFQIILNNAYLKGFHRTYNFFTINLIFINN